MAEPSQLQAAAEKLIAWHEHDEDLEPYAAPYVSALKSALESHADAIAAAERRGMERAARLVCGGCAEGHVASAATGWRHRVEHLSYRCPAADVWRALAGEEGRDVDADADAKQAHADKTAERKLAERIARALFTNGGGFRADRLVLKQGEGESVQARYIGGWYEAAVADLIERHLQFEPARRRPPQAGAGKGRG